MGLDARKSGCLDQIRRAGSPPYELFGGHRGTPRARKLAAADEFVVFDGIVQSVRLIPPVDWNQDPFDSRSWCAQLHTLRFLGIPLSEYHHAENLQALRQACDLVLDWAAQNKIAAENASSFAWLDKIAGDRAPFIGYVLRAGLDTKLLTHDEGERLLALALDHAEFLLDDSNYVDSSNHGLFQDLGLLTLSVQLETLAEARLWREASIRRFTATLSKHVDTDDGIYREHSPTYQWVIVNLLRNFCRIGRIESGLLVELQAALQSAAGWLVLPDGNTPPLGDSDMVSAPMWAQRLAAGADGLRLFGDAGLATVRHEKSMLITGAAYHTHAHKHSDELSFCLYEHGDLVLTEAGKHSYDDAHPARRYALSSSAHNVLLVDGNDFSFRSTRPYGSALTGAAECGGWFAIQGHNPLLVQQGVTHCRTFIYRPGELLVVVDSLQASARHRYTRLLHFGPSARVDLGVDGVSAHFKLGTAVGELRDASTESTQLTIQRGQDSPLAGWLFPSYGEQLAVPTVALDTYASDTALAFAVIFGENEPTIEIEGAGGDLITTTLQHMGTNVQVMIGSQGCESLQLNVD